MYIYELNVFLILLKFDTIIFLLSLYKFAIRKISMVSKVYKVDAFEQKICASHSTNHDLFTVTYEAISLTL